MDDDSHLPRLGWLERVALPKLGIPLLTAKIDTGAKTSSLHAEKLEILEGSSGHVARFLVRTKRKEYHCECAVHDERMVKSSSGHEELRVVVTTPCVLGTLRWTIELTLTDRTAMKYPMLLGRRAMADRFWVDPAGQFLAGKPVRKRKA